MPMLFKNPITKLSLAIALGAIVFVTSLSASADFNPELVDEALAQSLDAFYTPGAAIAVVKDGKVIYQKGHGLAVIQSSNTNQDSIDVTPNTYFRLASVSKAFTAASVAILVDEGKLKWQDKVIDHLPSFRLQDDYATKYFTVQDLLTHNSGLVSGAGDSMIWPEPSGFSRDEVVERLKFLTPEYPFKSRYAYSNVLYITAGQLVEKISKTPFDEFVDTKIFQALDMNCFAGAMSEQATANSAKAYAHNDAKGIYEVARNSINGDAQMSAAAGGMVCNVTEMSKWLKALLASANSTNDDAEDSNHSTESPETNQGDNQNGVPTLPFSKSSLERMWTSHTLLSVSDLDYEWDGTLFRSYGLGWRLANIGKYKFVSHTGTVSGYQAYVGLIPELQLGVVILNNGSNYGVRGALMQTVLKQFISDTDINWVEKYIEYQDEQEARYLANFEEPKGNGKVFVPASDIVGSYEDQWFGKLIITFENEQLRIQSSRQKTLVGTLTPFQHGSYKIDWDNENAQRDAFIHFEVDVSNTITGAKLHPFTTRSLTNHEYRDMHFLKVD